ncbi:MAG: dipeptidase [Candidatus Hermodarchaeota archaeon]
MGNLNEKTQTILESTLIVDSLSHGPIIWTDDLENTVNEMLTKEMDPWRIVQDIILEFAQKIVLDNNYFEKYVEAWNKAKVSCVSWTIGPIHEKPYTFNGVFHNFAFLTHIIENRNEFFQKILKTKDIENAFIKKKKGIIINLQDLGPIGSSLEMLELFYMMGIRIAQLTLNTRNLIGTGCLARRDRGLTEFGSSVIERMENLGIVVDISHCGPQTSMNAIEHSNNPVMATHTSAKSLYDHPRAKDDDILQAIAEKGGYIGVLTIQGFINNKLEPLIDDWIDHIDYLVNLVGIDHVGIGTDFYGHSIPHKLAVRLDDFLSKLGMGPDQGGSFQYKMKNFENYREFPNLIEGLINRGYSDNEIKKFAGENFIRVFKKVVG